MNDKTLLFLALFFCAAIAEAAEPHQIQPPTGQKEVLTVHAEGDQIYQCTTVKNGYAWTLKAPDARLYDDRSRIVGKHYAGPVWEYQDGSQVAGRVLKKLDMTPASAIPWLLLEAAAHKGQGVLAKVDFINRVHTKGGLAPDSGCDSNHPGAEKRVPYTADYVFYAKAL